MGRRFVTRCAGVVPIAAVALACAMPATASAKSGLACLSGKWVSNAVKSKSVSGLSGVKLSISSKGAASVSFKGASPLKFTGSAYSFHVNGSTTGTFHSKGGKYSYTPGHNDEQLAIYSGSSKLSSQAAASNQVPRFGGLTCHGSSLSTSLSIGTRTGGTFTATWSFRKA